MFTLPLTLRLFLCAVLVTLGACEQTTGATEVLVLVRADSDEVASQLSAIRAQLYSTGAAHEDDAIEDRNFVLGSRTSGGAKLTLPFSFVIEKAKASRFLLVVTGYRDDETEAVIEQKVIASFQDRRTVLLEIVLSLACYERASTCAGLDQTCYAQAQAQTEAGMCGSVTEAPVLPAKAGQELDASGLRNTASMDAGDTGGAETDGAGALRDTSVGDAGADDASGAQQDAAALVDDCQLTPCAHGGVCTEHLRSRSCVCVAGSGFTGSSCADNVDECASANACSGTTNGVAFSYACVDSVGEVAGYGCRGQFPDWPTPTSAQGRFSASGGVVADSQTGLRWQQVVDASTYTWLNANTYCAGLSLMGGGWRLPTRAELLSVVDYAKSNPAIDGAAFPGTPALVFWTSSAYVSAMDYKWGIDFYYSTSDAYEAGSARSVRCVR